MATRYDQKTKDEVVSFIQKHNAEKGRGGQSAAVAKWNLNPVTVKSWMDKAGVDSPGRGGKKRKAAKAGRPAKAARKGAKRGGRKADAGGSLEKTLNRMMKIRGEISALEAEYAALKDSL